MLGIYIRISKKKKKGEDTSKSTQEKYGIELANQLNISYQIYSDDGISGTKDEIEDRPEFARMIRDIENGTVTNVYTQYQDRLERNPDVWNLFKSVIIKNKCGWYPGGKKTDLEDPYAAFSAEVMSASNKLYSALTAARVKDSIRRRAEEGKFRGLKAYGYKQDEDGKLVIHSNESVIVQRIFQESIQGLGVYTIAKGLNEDEIPTRYHDFEGTLKRKDSFTGSITEYDKSKVRWRGNVVHDIIRNPIYKGEKWIKDVMYKVPHIIQPSDWEQVNNNLKVNKKKVGKKAKYRYLLNDLIVCASCGRKFVGKKRVASADNSYKCKGKIYPHPDCTTSRGININKLDSFILKHLFVDKTLKEIFSSIPKDDSLLKRVEKELKKQRVLLKRKQDEVKVARKRLLDPEFEDDPDIKKIYSQRKRELDSLLNKVQELETKRDEAEPNMVKKRTMNLLSQYVEGIEFDKVKSIVHGLLEWIKILHHKEEGKMGTFIVELKYKGYDEHSVFMTNWKATKWHWLSRYRGKAYTEEEKIEDQELLEYLLKANDEVSVSELKSKVRVDPSISETTQEELSASLENDFEGFETAEFPHTTIELTEEDMVLFD